MRPLVILFSLLTSPAFAGSVCTDLVPPEQYQDMPRPAYQTVAIENLYELHRICHKEVHLGCARRSTMTVFHLASLRGDPVRWRCFLRHEEAHLNGWPADHPTF